MDRTPLEAKVKWPCAKTGSGRSPLYKQGQELKEPKSRIREALQRTPQVLSGNMQGSSKKKHYNGEGRAKDSSNGAKIKKQDHATEASTHC